MEYLCLNGILSGSPPEGFVCTEVEWGHLAALASGHTLVTQLKID